MKSGIFWACVFPALAVFETWRAVNALNSNSGYMLPFIWIIEALATIAVAALIGAIMRCFWKSVGGAVLGIPLAYLAITVFTLFDNIFHH